jgi:hypothetical protein
MASARTVAHAVAASRGHRSYRRPLFSLVIALTPCLHTGVALAGDEGGAACVPARSGAHTALVRLAPETLSVATRGVTLSAQSSRRRVNAGERILVSGRVSIERGAPFPFRVLVVARPLGQAESALRGSHAIAYVRMDGSYAASLRPRRTSELRVIALPLRAGTHLAEASLGTISVRAGTCGP